MSFQFQQQIENKLRESGFAGEMSFGETMRRLYATDASEYQEMPVGVVWPRGAGDVQRLIQTAGRVGFSLIPRTAGTSLAGQCVGSGLVVDLSRHFTKILSIDAASGCVLVEPGVIRNELNAALAGYGLFFGPETSTANRAMIGGMVGNNSCGSNSIVYGSVREKLLRLRGFFSDGTFATIEPLNREQFLAKTRLDNAEGAAYRKLLEILSDQENRAEIRREFPKPGIPRRNTGYALDLLMDCDVFDGSPKEPFNLCKLIAGSEGTLFFATEIELHCDPLPPPHQVLVCCHFHSLDKALSGNLLAVDAAPTASELIDHHIIECSRRSPELSRKRTFLEGDPAALLVVEFREHSRESLDAKTARFIQTLEASGLAYAWPVFHGAACEAVWEFRRAGQGVIQNMPGDKKPREVAEDTAVDVRDLPEYVNEFRGVMDRHGVDCVYYGHASTGELHMRPIFSLRDRTGLATFRAVGTDVARLVKKYRGSLSGEHGDGRLRGEFLRLMIGDKCHALLAEVKASFDPQGIFNPGKIVDAPPMDVSLRHSPDHDAARWQTYFTYDITDDMLSEAEKCNGAGECLKTQRTGGTMCPSYMATRREEDSTRGRANLLRQLITEKGRQALADRELARVLDLCLGCKGCKSECPSSVDLARMKAEFLQEYYDQHGVSLRSRMVSEFVAMSRLSRLAPWAWNFVFGVAPLRRLANRAAGFHPARTIPLAPKRTWTDWFRNRSKPKPCSRAVYLYVDEFIDFQEPEIGIAAVELLEGLDYEVRWIPHPESGRSSLSKGFLRKARELARRNVRLFHPLVSEEVPLIGLEPSALLGFRDEFPSLLRGDEAQMAAELAPNCLLLDEFLVREYEAGRLARERFRENKHVIRLHGHCQQKALTGLLPTVKALELVPGHEVRLIRSGCCGMAGSFGYEHEHYELSMQIGELALFPTVREEPPENIICAPGTSCRHQIHDGTGRKALHPAQILRSALKQEAV